jgi:hypothetical protein
MVELAERFQNRFPQILPEVYTNSTFKVQSPKHSSCKCIFNSILCFNIQSQQLQEPITVSTGVQNSKR